MIGADPLGLAPGSGVALQVRRIGDLHRRHLHAHSQVSDAIVTAVAAAPNCSQATDSHLTEITGTLTVNSLTSVIGVQCVTFGIVET